MAHEPPNLIDVLLAEVDRLTPDEREVVADRLAELLAPRLAGRLATTAPGTDGWSDTKGAAAYLGLSPAALYRHTAARTIPFEQDCPGGKCWFERSELDAWRRGRGGQQPSAAWRDRW